MTTHRTSAFSSAAGAILAMTGVAIGLGNIWRFPYMMGQFGGSAFLACYLVIVFAFGVPGLMTEWALGRYTRSGPWQAFKRVGMPAAGLWRVVILITVIMAASYYAVVIGWVAQQMVAFVTALVTGATAPPFAALTDSFVRQMVYVIFTVVCGTAILAFGVRSGIERTSRILIPVFFLLFVILIVRTLTLPGAAAGLRQFLAPQWSHFTATTALAALGQAIFSLGLGGMFMVQYGSYMREQEALPSAAAATTAADVTAAVLAGLIIVPAAAAFGIDVAGGPSLMFVVMPSIFDSMPAGALFGVMFFFAVFIVALLSLIAAYEIIATTLETALGWSRGRALVVTALLEIVLAVPAYVVGGYIGISDLIWGSTMQPVGAALAIIAFTWCVARGSVLAELRRNSTLPVPTWLYYWIRFVIPAVILVVLVFGWVEWFQNR